MHSKQFRSAFVVANFDKNSCNMKSFNATVYFFEDGRGVVSLDIYCRAIPKEKIILLTMNTSSQREQKTLLKTTNKVSTVSRMAKNGLKKTSKFDHRERL